MPDLREVFEMATRQIEPDVDAWREQESRQRRGSRNRGVGAYALVAALAFAATVIVVSALPDGTGDRTAIAPLQRPSDGVALVNLDGTIVGIIGEEGSEEVQALLRQPLNGLSLSPEGTRVALSDGTDVYVMNVDGTGLRRLARGVTPSWSPDGARIAYGGETGLRVMSADGTDKRKVFRGTENLWPAWSPDGKRVAFQLRYYGATHGIAVIDVEGGDPDLLTNRGPDAFPAWHPAGDAIVFTRVGESQDLYTVIPEKDPSRASPLIAGDAGESLGRWSPSGELLAYVTFEGLYETNPREMDVHVLDTRTGEDRVVLEGATSVGWASDEVLIVVF